MVSIEIEPEERSMQAEIGLNRPLQIRNFHPGAEFMAPNWVNACSCSETYHVDCHSLTCKRSDRQVLVN